MIILLIIFAWIIASFLTAHYLISKGAILKLDIDFRENMPVPSGSKAEAILAVLILPWYFLIALNIALSMLYRAIKNN